MFVGLIFLFCVILLNYKEVLYMGVTVLGIQHRVVVCRVDFFILCYIIKL
nr:MAG TPA: hypothetical protein [Inoviridae sp.]